MVLANCTTPASFFHLLRRHMKIPFRTPLILFTPKSLLRHPRCLSPLEDFVQKYFQPLIDDTSVKPASVRKVLFCSGRIYYDLEERRNQQKKRDIALIRMEQLYPLAEKGMETLFKKYSQAKSFAWVQEEPENAGAWPFLIRKLKQPRLEYLGREESAAPATGFYKQHAAELEKILTTAMS